MLGILIGTAAKAAVTGAAGLAVIGVLKEFKVPDSLRQAAVTVTEAGLRGYKLVETGVDRVADVASEVFAEAKNRADAGETAFDTVSDMDADPVAEAEAVIAEAANKSESDGTDPQV